VSKINAYCSVSSSLFLPPSPLFVLLTSLRSARANTHAFIFCLSQIFVRPRINSHRFQSVCCCSGLGSYLIVVHCRH
jgi:hypothetical protein